MILQTRTNHRRRIASPTAPILCAGILVCAVALPGDAAPDHTDRVVHRFDFDERGEGNLEDVPKFWEPFRPRHFPHFTHGTFDFEIGHDAAPSFHLASAGRDVAYQYRGPDARVRANTDYRIEGFVRPDRLPNGRACLSAQFLDGRGRPIGGTLVRSTYVGGGVTDDSAWSHVEMFLAPAPPQARSIALIAWVLQEATWNTAAPPRRHIEHTDVLGGAWFDDITIDTLPHAELKSSSPGNVLVADESPELLITLADHDDAELEGLLTVQDADGRDVETHAIAVRVSSREGPSRVSVGHLAAGVYRARLDVFSNGKRILARSLRFAVLVPRFSPPGALAREFGIVVDPRDRSDPDTEVALLLNQVARSVKVPVWTGLPDPPPSAPERHATDRAWQALARNSFAMIAVCAGAPSAIVRASGAYGRPLFELLSDDPAAWSEHLAVVVAPNASLFRSWQLGPDTGGASPSLKRLRQAVDQVRSAMRRFITSPQLALVRGASIDEPDAPALVEDVTISLDANTPASEFPSLIRKEAERGHQSVSVYIEPLAADRYRRIPRLAQWARRIITARHAGAATVFTPQTWRVRDTSQGHRTEPTEEYVVLRTIADVLAATTPGPRLTVADGVSALVFERGDRAVLALWDDGAPAGGRSHTLQLGRAQRSIDVWGRSASLERDDRGRHVVRLSPLPVFVDGVESWLLRLQSSITLSPSHIESGSDIARITASMRADGTEAVSGEGALLVPEGWRVLPRRFTFSVLPHRAEKFEFEVRLPHSEPAGRRDVRVALALRDRDMFLEIPRTIDLDLSDVDVAGMATVERGGLVLRHMVTNRSEATLSFRGSAYVPGRERQYRPLANLRPGDSQIVEYRFPGGEELIGRGVRLVLSEMADGPRIHNLRLTVP